jgi:flavin-dependent dehydrogenase
VRVEVSAAESISVSEEAVHVNGIKADYLCIASGANNRVLRQLGLEDRRRASEKPKRIGLRRHVNIKPWSDKVEVYWRDRCELYVTPVADHCVNIAILSFESLDFDSAIDLFPEVKNKIKDATWDDLPRGRGPLSHRSNRVQKGRVLVAGDAALFIDAMTGEGNTLAMRSGIAVAKAIMSGKPILYRWLWLGVVWRYWLVTAPLLWLSGKSRVRNRLLQFVVRYPLVLRIGVRFLSADLSRKRVSDFQYGAQ